jgi:hypothetical protein
VRVDAEQAAGAVLALDAAARRAQRALDVGADRQGHNMKGGVIHDTGTQDDDLVARAQAQLVF